MDAPRQRTVIGAMTGTSMDAVDAVLAAIDGSGPDMKARPVRHATVALGTLGDDLRRAAAGEPMTARHFAGLALELAGRYGEAIADAALIADDLDLIAVAGQTIVHCPPVSWQLLNPAPIAARFKCPVLFDLRQGDLAAGGRGAPITPIADWVLFRATATTRAVVNLGGFCNVTVLPAGRDPGSVAGFDVCACNHVLDEVARRTLGAPYDDGGGAARSGAADAAAVAALNERLDRQRTAGRSLGTGDEAHVWVAEYGGALSPRDLAASAVEAIAACIGRSLADRNVDDVVVAGGGTCNGALLAALERHCGKSLRTTDELGVPARAREGLAVAVLAALSVDGVAVTLPQVTGRDESATMSTTWCVPRDDG